MVRSRLIFYPQAVREVESARIPVRLSASALSRRCVFGKGCESLLDRGGKSYRNEICGGVKVVFSGVIDNPEETAPFGSFVWKDLVELTELQVFAAIVPDADSKVRKDRVAHGFGLLKQSFDLEGLTSDAMRLVPMHLSS